MEGEKMEAPFYRFVKQAPEKKWFSDASYGAIGGLCLETGVYWRYHLALEVQLTTVRSKRGKGDRILINRADGGDDDGVRDDSDEEGQAGQRVGDDVDAGG